MNAQHLDRLYKALAYAYSPAERQEIRLSECNQHNLPPLEDASALLDKWKEKITTLYGSAILAERLQDLEKQPDWDSRGLFSSEFVFCNINAILPSWARFCISAFSHARHINETDFTLPLNSAEDIANLLLSPFIELYEKSLLSTQKQENILRAKIDSVAQRSGLVSLKQELLEMLMPLLIGATKNKARSYPLAANLASVFPLSLVWKPHDKPIELVLTFYEQCPMLLRRLSVVSRLNIMNHKVLAKRLYQDANEIELLFKISLSHLEKIDYKQSDPHCNHKSVAFLCFSNKQKLVYKPRSFTPDITFCSIVDTIDKQDTRKWRQKVLAKNGYGYSAWLNHAAVKDYPGIHDYYYNYGSLLALIFYLGGTDFHEENIIANECWPVPIDLEGLLSYPAPLVGEIDYDLIGEEYSPYDLGVTLMLPRYSQIASRDKPVTCVSPLHQVKKNRVDPLLSRLINTDNIGFCLKSLDQSTHAYEHITHLPIYKNNPVSVDGYEEDILRGFRHIWQRCRELNSRIIDTVNKMYSLDQSPIIRRLLRNSQEYADILEVTNNISCSKSYLHMSVSIDSMLAGGLNFLPSGDTRTSAINNELEQLIDMDIPIFFSEYNTQSVSSPLNQSVFKGLFSTKDIFIRTVNNYALKSDANLHTKRIISSLMSYKLCMQEVSATTANSKKTLSISDSIKGIASDCIQFIEKASIQYGAGLIVPNLISLSGGSALNQVISSPSTLDGLSGSILFLKTAQQLNIAVPPCLITDIEKSLTERTLALLQHQVVRPAGYSGALMPLYALLYGNQSTLSSSNSLDYCQQILNKLPLDSFSEHQSYDVLSGLAGDLLILIKVSSQLGNMGLASYMEQISELIRDHLKTLIRDFNRTGSQPAFVRSGFAHGISGLVYSLLSYQLHIKNCIDEDIVLSSLHIENSLKVKTGQWLHRRTDSQNRVSGWCNGPAGIGLTRLALFKAGFRNDDLMNDIEEITNTLIDTPWSKGIHNLCCGTSSILIYLKNYSVIAKSSKELANNLPAANSHIDLIARSLLDEYLSCSSVRLQQINSGVLVTGLLSGLPGVIYSLWYATSSKRLPNIMLAE